jgi:ABC-type phosphate/phosphonate transport system substrate-binding protein
MSRPVRLGAVMYDPKVSVIWEIIRNFFESKDCPMDVTFYASYELQIDALVAGAIDIAWNSPLAWLDAQRRSGGTCRAIAMRDTDRDRTAYLVAQKGGAVESLASLRGNTIAVGALDSPQATLIPLGLLRKHGIEPGRNVNVRRFDVLVGKHGDHIGGELEAFQCVGRSEAGACAMLDLNWETWTHDGTIDPTRFTIIAATPKFDHCVFTARGDLEKEAEAHWLDTLFSMRYDEPAHREMMDLEGLKAWLAGRTTGFQALTDAVAAERFFERQPG